MMLEPRWDGKHLWLGGLWIGQVVCWGKRGPDKERAKTPFRGWLMSEEDGEETGWYATEDEARAAVEAQARALLRIDEQNVEGAKP